MSLSRINSLDRKEERIVGCGIVFVVTTCCRCRSFSFVVIVAACVVARCGYGCRFRSLSFSPSPVVVVFARCRCCHLWLWLSLLVACRRCRCCDSRCRCLSLLPLVVVAVCCRCRVWLSPSPLLLPSQRFRLIVEYGVVVVAVVVVAVVSFGRNEELTADCFVVERRLIVAFGDVATLVVGGQEDEKARSETIRSLCCIHVASCCLGGGCLLLSCCGWFRCWVKTISLVAVCPCRCPPMPYPSMSNLPLSSLPAIFVYSIIIRLQS